MADQLLSQADVDALVSSLTRSEPAKPAAPATAASARSTVAGMGQKTNNLPVTHNQPSAAISAPAVKAGQPSAVKPGQAKPAAPVSSKPAQPVPAKSGQAPRGLLPARPEGKADVSVEMFNTMNARIADLSKQLAQMGSVLKRLELLEKKAADLDVKIAKNKEAPATAQRVQELNEAVKKISTNLKGTPGYGVRHTFSCEKCSDEGHVAVMYRCTKCGHERWYGWWPEKK
jgi:hypothetical protein